MGLQEEGGGDERGRGMSGKCILMGVISKEGGVCVPLRAAVILMLLY